MTDLEDLRERPLGWHVDVRHKRRCDILSEGHSIGMLNRPNAWKGLYQIDLGGVHWQVASQWACKGSVDHLGFANKDYGLAEFRSVVQGVETLRIGTVDGVPYRLRHEEPGRAVWRDAMGFAMLSFTRKANLKMGFRPFGSGAIHAFQACPIPHAPPLLIFGLMQIVYRAFFMNDNEAGASLESFGSAQA